MECFSASPYGKYAHGHTCEGLYQVSERLTVLCFKLSSSILNVRVKSFVGSQLGGSQIARVSEPASDVAAMFTLEHSGAACSPFTSFTGPWVEIVGQGSSRRHARADARFGRALSPRDRLQNGKVDYAVHLGETWL